MDYYKAFPFYLGYQGKRYDPQKTYNEGYNLDYMQWQQNGFVEEDRILEDLEYLQQMYPSYAKKYQSVIVSAVDKVDYNGSFIYDQYPDKLTLQQIVNSVMAIIKRNEENIVMQDGDINPLSEKASWADKEKWIQELVTVLLYYEILGRRRKNKR